MALQKEIDTLPKDGTLQLSPGDLPGPIVISRPLTLEGKGTTIWALKGPVVSIRSDHVTLRNLTIEVTSEGWNGSAEEACAIAVASSQSTVLENVKISGAMTGLPEEDGLWRYPYLLQMDKFPHGQEYDLLLRLIVPVPCRLTSNIYGLNVEPRSLSAGKNEIRLHLERLALDTFINGTLALSTAFLTRQIMVSGHIVAVAAGKSPAKDQILWQPPDWATVSFAPKPTPKPPEPAPPPPQPVMPPVAPPAKPASSRPSVNVAKPPSPPPPALPPKPVVATPVSPVTNPPGGTKPSVPTTPIPPPSQPSLSSFRRPGKPVSTLFKDNKQQALAEAIPNQNDGFEKKNAAEEKAKLQPPEPLPVDQSTKASLSQPKKAVKAPDFQHTQSIPLNSVFTPKPVENNAADKTKESPPEKPLPVNQPSKQSAPAKPKPGNPNNIAPVFGASNKTIKKG